MQIPSGELLILTGPHGAGKDSVDQHLRARIPTIDRVVRYITRAPSETESDGVDYHFVTTQRFLEMIDAGAFIEYAPYPDVYSGTAYDDVSSMLQQQSYASVTINIEDALKLGDSLRRAGIRTRSFFISPVDETSFTTDATDYLSALKQRMEDRRRYDDRIANKLGKAVVYREIYLADPSSFTYVYNPDNRIEDAVRTIEMCLQGENQVNQN